MSSTTVVTYTCDRPGCGNKIESPYRVGGINFTASRDGDSWVSTSGSDRASDICESCQHELVKFWFKLTK